MAFGTEPIGSGRFAVRKRARRSVKGRHLSHNFKARRRIAVFVRKSKYSARLRQTETRPGRRRAGTVFTINQSGRPPFLPHKAPKSRIDLFICYWNGSDERCRRGRCSGICFIIGRFGTVFCFYLCFRGGQICCSHPIFSSAAACEIFSWLQS